MSGPGWGWRVPSQAVTRELETGRCCTKLALDETAAVDAKIGADAHELLPRVLFRATPDVVFIHSIPVELGTEEIIPSSCTTGPPGPDDFGPVWKKPSARAPDSNDAMLTSGNNSRSAPNLPWYKQAVIYETCVRSCYDSRRLRPESTRRGQGIVPRPLCL